MKEQQGFTQEQEQYAPTGKREIHSFSNYDLVRRIDVGGMGEVYLAHQRTAFGREVAVKIIRSDLVYDVTARKRFQREAEVSAYLKHDHILPLLEFGEEQGRLFLVTPYIKGGTLARRLHAGPLPINEIHQLFTALAEAVAYLHRRGVVHRDLKPSNILLDRAEDNGRVYVRLIDFGIASLQGAQASAPLTMAGHEMGTLAYMAPERLDGVAAPSNDLYSLGIILFQMITSRLPSDEPQVQLPEPLAYVIRHCTATNPHERFATAEELLQVFEQAYQAVKRELSAQELASLSQTAFVNTPSVPESAHPTPTNEESVARKENTPQQKEEKLLKEQSAHESVFRANRLTVTASHPALPHEETVRQTTGSQPILSRGGRTIAGSTSSSARSEIILPPLPGKNESFSGTDYDAPTSHIEIGSEKSPKSKKQRLAASATAGTGPQSTLLRGQRSSKRPLPVVALISLCIFLVIGLIAAVSYAAFQGSTTATVTLMPRTQVVSEVFSITAKVNANADVGSATIPANVLSSTQSNSLEGQTSGSTGCVLGIFDCKQAVSSLDVLTLSTQLRPALQDQIRLDLQRKAKTANALTVSDVFFSDNSISSDPQVGTVSKTVRVSMTMMGSQEYIKTKDAQDLARQLLNQKLKKDYQFLDSLLQVGTPVVKSVDANGTVKMAIAAGGVASYHFPDSELTRLQDSIKGLKISEARALLAKQGELDPAALTVRVSFGDTIPKDIHLIKFNVLNPSNVPRVQLTPVPTNAP
jgi:serine/threonine protein kinase